MTDILDEVRKHDPDEIECVLLCENCWREGDEKDLFDVSYHCFPVPHGDDEAVVLE